MNLQDAIGSYILENPVGSCIGFLPGYMYNSEENVHGYWGLEGSRALGSPCCVKTQGQPCMYYCQKEET